MREETRLSGADDIQSVGASATGCGPRIFNGEPSPNMSGYVAVLAPNATPRSVLLGLDPRIHSGLLDPQAWIPGSGPGMTEGGGGFAITKAVQGEA